MKVYFDWSYMGKSTIVCNCCGKMWTEDAVTPLQRKNKNEQARESERVANKNGWLIHDKKNFHVCDECAEYMVTVSYLYSIEKGFEDRNR